MSRKVTKEEFLNRFYSHFPEADITVLEYNGIRASCSIRCNICGKEYTKTQADYFIKSWTCCGKLKTRKFDWLKQKFDNHETEIEPIKTIGDGTQAIFRHATCGEFTRDITKQFQTLTYCPYCNDKNSKLSLNIQEAKNILMDTHCNIELLEYGGYNERKSKFRCLDCGMIFINRFHAVNKLLKYPCPRCAKKSKQGRTTNK